MYSYPNLIPLPASKVEEIAAKVKPLQFNRLYNAFSKVVKENASEAVQRSAALCMKQFAVESLDIAYGRTLDRFTGIFFDNFRKSIVKPVELKRFYFFF